MTRVPRFNAGPVVVHPRENLRDALIVWDTRSWNGMTNGPIIPNQGSAGSAFDIAVTNTPTASLVAPQMGTVHALGTVTGDWDLLGGPPCDGPFTVMVAGLRGDGSVKWPNSASNAAMIGFTTGPISYRRIDLRGSGTPNGGRVETTSSQGGFWTLTYDPVDGGSTVWRELAAFLGSITREGTVGSCRYVPDAESGNIISDLRMGAPTILRPSEGVGPVGFVLFRGEPSAADMAYWEAYFDTPVATPFSYELTSPYDPSAFMWRREWFDDDYCYHWMECMPSSTDPVFTFTDVEPIVGKTLPATIDFILVGAGQNAAGEASGLNRRGGGGGGGEVVEVLGHTAPVASTEFKVGAFGNVGSCFFEGYGATGRPSGTLYPFIGPNGANDLSGAAGTGGTGTLSPAGGGGGGGAGGNGGNSSGTTGGDGGDGIASDWHWTGATVYHGTGGPGGGTVVGARPGPVGLGAGAQGTFVTGAPGVQGGGSAGLVIRYERQH